MTDNVVKAGIEDVLSSVKRLVSEEGRKAPSSGARKPGRLVLTEALRISKPAQVEQPPLKLEPKYSAEESAKPMLLRACDIVKADAAANSDAPRQEEARPEPEATEDPATSLSAKIEALEAAIARTEDQWEPDGDSDDAYSGTPTQGLAWTTDSGFEEPEPEDVPAEQATDGEDAAAAAEPEQEEPQPATFIRSPEVMPVAEDAVPARDVAIDEDALRDMIAEVVRQELQGVLGERITRNVRKMVRREIHRALAAQELE